MKLLFFLSCIFLLTVSAQQCNNKKNANVKNDNIAADSTAAMPNYKAKLEIKAICMNYTLRLTQGSLDTSQVAAAWTDETTGKSYKNVFALGNPCTFPPGIELGQEFSFVIDTTREQKQCAVCLAYYPTPPKKLFIKVLQ
jgi:hypothetical protein